MPSIAAAILTFILLVVFSVSFLFVEVVALNGASERQGTIALGTSVVCQAVGLLLATILASWLSRIIISRFKLHVVVAVILAVVAAVTLGGLIAFVSVIVAIPIAGIR